MAKVGLHTAEKSLNSLAREIEYLLRQGADYSVVPSLGADIFDQIDAFLARFVAYPDEHARHAHVLWTAHTWFMDCWQHTPRLLFVSPEAGSGKTRALTVTASLVPRADLVGDLTPAALYHSIDEALEVDGGRPTILYDELDTVFGSAEEGRIRDHRMRRLLDIGHDKNATIKRTIRRRGGRAQTTRYQVYTAMALAGKMDVYDVPATIRTRSVTIRMQRRLPDEKVERWDRRVHPEEAASLRELLQLWAELVHSRADRYFAPLPDAIEDRDADVWLPLLSVADLAGGPWPTLARVAGVAFVAVAGTKATPSIGVQLLEDIRTVFDQCGLDRLPSVALLDRLKRLEASRWPALTPRKLAMQLSGYRIEPQSFRIGTQVLRGYQRWAFEEAWLRYLPPTATTATAATTELPDE